MDSLFVKMYGDWSAGRLTESNFNPLSERYQVEQAELDAPLLNTLIERILVHEGVKGPNGVWEQEVEIFYRFVGKTDF